MIFGKTLQGKLTNIQIELLRNLPQPMGSPQTMEPLAHLPKLGNYGEKSCGKLQKPRGNAIMANQASIYYKKTGKHNVL